MVATTTHPSDTALYDLALSLLEPGQKPHRFQLRSGGDLQLDQALTKAAAAGATRNTFKPLLKLVLALKGRLASAPAGKKILNLVRDNRLVARILGQKPAGLSRDVERRYARLSGHLQVLTAPAFDQAAPERGTTLSRMLDVGQQGSKTLLRPRAPDTPPRRAPAASPRQKSRRSYQLA